MNCGFSSVLQQTLKRTISAIFIAYLNLRFISRPGSCSCRSQSSYGRVLPFITINNFLLNFNSKWHKLVLISIQYAKYFYIVVERGIPQIISATCESTTLGARYIYNYSTSYQSIGTFKANVQEKCLFP